MQQLSVRQVAGVSMSVRLALLGGLVVIGIGTGPTYRDFCFCTSGMTDQTRRTDSGFDLT